jgi:ring-1,2-phenylacetyl-CoA epoxidase subunit PaaB
MNQLKSLDPRVVRLPKTGEVKPKTALDQFGTFEVFVQPKEGKTIQHEGCVHAPNLEMAFVLAKEAFTRRFACISIYVADTRDVFVSPTTEGNQTAYDLVPENKSRSQNKTFEVYHLPKRGKQHIHVGSVEASSADEAMLKGKVLFGGDKIVHNVWAIDRMKIRFTSCEEKDLWDTLPEKTFRDAAAYKGGDKLKEFLEKQKTQGH